MQTNALASLDFFFCRHSNTVGLNTVGLNIVGSETMWRNHVHNNEKASYHHGGLLEIVTNFVFFGHIVESLALRWCHCLPPCSAFSDRKAISDRVISNLVGYNYHQRLLRRTPREILPWKFWKFHFLVWVFPSMHVVANLKLAGVKVVVVVRSKN